MTAQKREVLKRPWYNADGLQWEYQNQDIAVVAEWIDPYLTILRSAITNEIVGVELKMPYRKKP